MIRLFRLPVLMVLLIETPAFSAAAALSEVQKVEGYPLGAPHLYDVQCQSEAASEPNLEPTGCVYPAAACAQNVNDGDPIRSCENASISPACNDFTWEKCCFVTCNQKDARGQHRYGRLDDCIAICMSSSGAVRYIPQYRHINNLHSR